MSFKQGAPSQWTAFLPTKYTHKPLSQPHRGTCPGQIARTEEVVGPSEQSCQPLTTEQTSTRMYIYAHRRSQPEKSQAFMYRGWGGGPQRRIMELRVCGGRLPLR